MADTSVQLVSWVWIPDCCGMPVQMSAHLVAVADVADNGRPCLRYVMPEADHQLVRKAVIAHTAQHN